MLYCEGKIGDFPHLGLPPPGPNSGDLAASTSARATAPAAPPAGAAAAATSCYEPRPFVYF